MQITGSRQKSACNLILSSGSRQQFSHKMSVMRLRQYSAFSRPLTLSPQITLFLQTIDTSQVQRYACICCDKDTRKRFIRMRTSTLWSHLLWTNQRFLTCIVSVKPSSIRQVSSSRFLKVYLTQHSKQEHLKMTKNILRIFVSLHSLLRESFSTRHSLSCLGFSANTNSQGVQSKFSTSCVMNPCTSISGVNSSIRFVRNSRNFGRKNSRIKSLGTSRRQHVWSTRTRRRCSQQVFSV